MTTNPGIAAGEAMYRKVYPDPEGGDLDYDALANPYKFMKDTPLNRGALEFSAMNGDEAARKKLGEWDRALAAGLPADMNAPLPTREPARIGDQDPGLAAQARAFGSG